MAHRSATDQPQQTLTADIFFPVELYPQSADIDHHHAHPPANESIVCLLSIYVHPLTGRNIVLTCRPMNRVLEIILYCLRGKAYKFMPYFTIGKWMKIISDFILLFRKLMLNLSMCYKRRRTSRSDRSRGYCPDNDILTGPSSMMFTVRVFSVCDKL